MNATILIVKRIVALVALTAGVCATIPVGMYLFGRPDLSLPLGYHVFSVAAMVTGMYLLTGQTVMRGNVWWLFALVASATMPMYGALATVTIYTAQRFAPKRPPPILSDEIEVPHAEVFTQLRPKLRSLEVLARLDIEPFVDIFRGGQAELKKSAVKYLGNIRSTSALATLNVALMDRDIEVRLFAAGVLGLIDDDFTKGIDTAKAHFAAAPHRSDVGLALADLYMAYADSGLLDRIAKMYYYRETLRIAGAYPENEQSSYLMARSYAALTEYDEARALVERCIAMGAVRRDYDELLCAILFAQKDYAALVAVVERARARENSTLNKEIVQFWS